MQMQNVIIYDYFRIHFYILSRSPQSASWVALGIKYKFCFIVYFSSMIAAGFKNVYGCVYTSLNGY